MVVAGPSGWGGRGARRSRGKARHVPKLGGCGAASWPKIVLRRQCGGAVI